MPQVVLLGYLITQHHRGCRRVGQVGRIGHRGRAVRRGSDGAGRGDDDGRSGCAGRRGRDDGRRDEAFGRLHFGLLLRQPLPQQNQLLLFLESRPSLV